MNVFLLQSELHEVYVDSGDYHIAVASAADASDLTKILLPLVFNSFYLKYCSVGKDNISLVAGYIRTDGTIIPYASLNEDAVDALIGKKLNKFIMKFLYIKSLFLSDCVTTEYRMLLSKEEAGRAIKNIISKECSRKYRGLKD
jgi:hypothetical protein